MLTVWKVGYCSSFYYYDISIIVSKTDVQSGLAIFLCTNLPSGSIREIIVLPAGKIKEHCTNGYKQRGIDISISQHFSKKPKLTNRIRKSPCCHLDGLNDFELSSVSV